MGRREVPETHHGVTHDAPEFNVETALGERYVVHARLHRGRRNELYDVRDRITGRFFVAKSLMRKASRHEEDIERFADEIEALERVQSHANIVSFAAQERLGDQRPILIMERLPDPTPARFSDVAAASQAAISVAHALDHMHRRGIVHRDIRPENLLLGADGHIKVIDFGSAFDLRRRASEHISAHHEGSGTLDFMPPEQFRMAFADPAADFYALGTTLFVWLTGALPFPKLSKDRLLEAKLSGQPTLPSRFGDLPRSLQTFLLACIHPDPSERHGHRDGFVDRLQSIVATMTDVAQPRDPWETEQIVVPESEPTARFTAPSILPSGPAPQQPSRPEPTARSTAPSIPPSYPAPQQPSRPEPTARSTAPSIPPSYPAPQQPSRPEPTTAPSIVAPTADPSIGHGPGPHGAHTSATLQGGELSGIRPFVAPFPGDHSAARVDTRLTRRPAAPKIRQAISTALLVAATTLGLVLAIAAAVLIPRWLTRGSRTELPPLAEATMHPAPSPRPSPTIPTPPPPVEPAPTPSPFDAPTEAPAPSPFDAPTEAPAPSPFDAPTEAPAPSPFDAPTEAPAPSPSDAPTEVPTPSPSDAPTEVRAPEDAADLPSTLNAGREITTSPHAAMNAGVHLPDHALATASSDADAKSSPRPAVPLHETAGCAVTRTQTEAAVAAFDWPAVVTRTTRTGCWERRSDWERLRVKALSETQQWERCVKFGNIAKTSYPKAVALMCQAKLEDSQ